MILVKRCQINCGSGDFIVVDKFASFFISVAAIKLGESSSLLLNDSYQAFVLLNLLQ